MTKAFLTVCTADHFQHYIPLFAYCLRKFAADIHIFVRGELDEMTESALTCFTPTTPYIFEGVYLDYPYDVSTTNCLRFLTDTPALREYDYVLILDIDLLLFTDPFPWMISELKGKCFMGHHGPYTKPKRPGISPWHGNMERIAGGFFLVTKDWWEKTAGSREFFASTLKNSNLRLGTYRESDEVMLARIVKEAGMLVPESKYFPSELRGVHLGDFKASMSHRWTNIDKMVTKLSIENCFNYQRMANEDTWKKMIEALEGDGILMQILGNVGTHIQKRGPI